VLVKLLNKGNLLVDKFVGYVFVACLFLFGCAGLPAARDLEVDRIALAGGMERAEIHAGRFDLRAYYRLAEAGKPLAIYIEGDGAAWLTKGRLSADPTPRHPMVLRLAALDPSANVVYLARPCQYNGAGDAVCDPEYWSDKRFSPEVIEAMDEAVSYFAKKAAANSLRLVGYSGGGAVAVILAARRNDVESLLTVAGNLDPEAVNRHHRVSALTGSLDPVNFGQRIAGLPQWHFVGTKDKVIPNYIAQGFVRKIGSPRTARIVQVDGASHHDGWIERWATLLEST